MAKNNSDALQVACPCCQAKLAVEPLSASFVSRRTARTGPNVDLTDAAGIFAEQNRQREDKFRDSWFQESNKEDILAKKFEEAMKKGERRPRCRGQTNPRLRPRLIPFPRIFSYLGAPELASAGKVSASNSVFSVFRRPGAKLSVLR